MKQYLDMLYYILKNGEERQDRTGTGTIGVFGYQNRHDLSKGFPLLTTKKMPMRVIFEELKWFLNGDTNVKSLIDKNVNIWNADAYRHYKSSGGKSPFDEFIGAMKHSNGTLNWDLGPIYGKQWRSWHVEKSTMFGTKIGVVDQIANVIESIKNDPFGRRHIVSAWNVADIPDMALPPCHVMFQFYVTTDGRLSCQLYQRSADVFLGVPFNIASYSLLVHMIAHVTGLKVGEFVHTFGDLHLYKNHVDQAWEQIKREPKFLPQLYFNRKVENIDDFQWEDINLVNYDPHPLIKGSVSVGK